MRELGLGACGLHPGASVNRPSTGCISDAAGFPNPGVKNEVAVIEGFDRGARPCARRHVRGDHERPQAHPDDRRHGALARIRLRHRPRRDRAGSEAIRRVLHVPGGASAACSTSMERSTTCSLVTLANVDTRRIVDALDAILEPHGGSGARDREDHFSHAFLDAELGQLKAMAVVMPPIFLLVAAFLVNLILSRLVALEREQIGLAQGPWLRQPDHRRTLRQAGRRDRPGRAAHRLGRRSVARRELTRLYADFFSFPFLLFRHSLDLHAIGGGVTIAACAGRCGQGAADRRGPVARRRHESPDTDPLSQLLRRQAPTARPVLPAHDHGVAPSRALAGAVSPHHARDVDAGRPLVTSMFSYDSIDSLIDTVFFRAERQDATLIFASNLGPQAVFAAAALPGVLRAEPFRYEAVNLRTVIAGSACPSTVFAGDRDLSRILDLDLNPVPETPRGIMLSERVAERLGLEPGMRVEVELLARDRRIANVTVAALASSYLGLTAYMHIDELGRLMRDGRRISGVKVSLDDGELARLHDRVKKTPAIASIALQSLSLARFRETVERNITTTTAVYVVLAVIIAFGVRLQLGENPASERARESRRVSGCSVSVRRRGFKRADDRGRGRWSSDVPSRLGWLLGYLMAWAVAAGVRQRHVPHPPDRRHRDVRPVEPGGDGCGPGVGADRAAAGGSSSTSSGP